MLSDFDTTTADKTSHLRMWVAARDWRQLSLVIIRPTDYSQRVL